MASSSTSLISGASSSSTRPWKRDVFLSFRGEDTRNSFTDHLHAGLKSYGIKTFIDDQLNRGERISSELLQAIEESRCSIIVFSEHYASSSWCLDELSKIIEYQKSGGHTVFPVFYNVDPSHVRKQRGSYGEALAQHEEAYKDNMDKVLQWREALTVASGLSGWDCRGRRESKVVEQIAFKIFNELLIEESSSNVKDLVGMGSRIQEMLSLLCIGSTDVRMIGVWGMGGVGKTTIAEVVYQRICSQFEACCFVSNITEKSQRNENTQMEVLLKILGKHNLNSRYFNSGINLIEKALRSKKVLIVLDDINHIKQFKALAGDHKWFGPGSRIIITSRDKHLLIEKQVDEIFVVKELIEDEAFQLFCQHAFRHESPPKDFVELCYKAVNYNKGLPLALKILGCFFYKRSKMEWESELEKLKRYPHADIQNVLRISYDGLDDNQKEVFLDIACFFSGEEKDYVVEILRNCDFFPEIEINILVERSLLTINGYNKELRMHNLIQEMGQEIIRKQSIDDPGRRKRLFMKRDIMHVLAKNSGIESVEGIALHLDELEELHFNAEVFKKMKKLRVLRINVAKLHPWAPEKKCNFHVIGDLKSLSDNLISLHWDVYPFKSLPLNFDPQMLVELNMKCSRLKTAWEGNKSFPKLKFINLSHSKHLTETLNFSGAPKLSRIVIEGCISLTKVHSSIGTLKKLSLLNLKGCSKLKKLPESICELTSLENLDISGCSKLKKLPNDIRSLQGLVNLEADGSGVEELPASFALLTKLQRLSLARCKGGESKSRSTLALCWGLPPTEGLRLGCLSGLRCLAELILSDCNLMEGALPNDLGSLSSLRHLDLRRNNFTTLPASLSQLRSLGSLILDDCKSLRSLTELPSSIQKLLASNCTSLETFSYPSLIIPAWYGAPSFQFCGCLRLMKNEESDILEITLSRIRVAPSIPRWCGFTAMVPGSEIPKWFIHQREGNSVTLKVPPDCHNNTLQMGMAFCVVLEPAASSMHLPEADHICLGYQPIKLQSRRINYLGLSVMSGPKVYEVKKCGFRFVYEPWGRQEEIRRIQNLKGIQSEPCRTKEEMEAEIARIQAIQYDTVPFISCPPSSLLEFPNEAWSSKVQLLDWLSTFGVLVVKFIEYGPFLNPEA